MKLLFCKNCHDVFSLRRTEKTCHCGSSKGQYLNNLDAVYSGDCIPLGFDNPNFVQALERQPEKGMGEVFRAFVIPKICPTFKEIK